MSEPPDIEIGGSARIRRLRFEDEPDTEVRYLGDYQAETLRQRENLPDEVEPGKTYRNVWVARHTKVRLDVDPDELSD